MSSREIRVWGAKTHNLAGIDVTLPRDALVVITGVSGSGKSSLAFDTIYAEGQRRYVESLSTYARQFLEQLEAPDVDGIDGLSPALALEQKAPSNNPRSTVATATEVYDHLRVLWARAGVPACPSCGDAVEQQTPDDIVDGILAERPRTKVMLLAPVARGRRGTHEKTLRELQREGFSRIRVDGEVLTLDESVELDGRKRHDIDVVVDRLVVKDGIRSRLADSVELALRVGGGTLLVVFPDRGEERPASERHACQKCGISLPELEPRLFSFNSPRGACPTCNGLGDVPFVDPERVVPNPDLSLAQDAISPWAGEAEWFRPVLEAVARHLGVSMDTPWGALPASAQETILFGSGDEVIPIELAVEGQRVLRERPFEGVLEHIRRAWRESASESRRAALDELMSQRRCQDCQGSRLRPEADGVRVGGLRLHELTSMPVAEARGEIERLEVEGGRAKVAERLVAELRSRLAFLDDVGLGYLTLERPAGTLSGGEAQRIRLATQLGSALMGVLYVLDEPSIGLHPKDTGRLLDTLHRLRDLGNTVLVVEHDEVIMRAADYLVDMGPGAGRLGGQVVAAGTPETVATTPASLTGAYLSGRRRVREGSAPRADASAHLRLEGARGHNLRDVTLDIPLERLVCITGVSGSGKSTLIERTLVPAVARKLHRARARPEPFDALRGLAHLDKLIAIDQSPIGRTPKSSPATYTGLFSDIRDLFAGLPEAKMRGYKSGRFSFNTKGGRCEKCQGEGSLRVEMHFLPDAFVTCEACGGRRYNRETLEVRFKGFSIADVLEMTVEESLGLLGHIPAAERKLRTLREVGLGYVSLGQPAPTLSGGEAQRVKLAKALARVATGRTLYFLDEPTTGLHFEDVRKLLELLHRLVDRGNTVLVIEHDLDVISAADWVVDLGPEGGPGGGRLVAEGPPDTVARAEGSHTGAHLAARLRALEGGPGSRT